MPINTVIVDDEKPARDELAFLLKGFPEISLIGQGKNGLEAVTLIKEHSPDLVFLDVQMPGLDGFGVLQEARRAQSSKSPTSSSQPPSTTTPSKPSTSTPWTTY